MPKTLGESRLILNIMTMKSSEKFEGYLIPSEYLEGIKGGMRIEARSAVKCPSCTTNAPIIATKDYPPSIFVCTGCGCIWRIILVGGVYQVDIIGDGK